MLGQMGDPQAVGSTRCARHARARTSAPSLDSGSDHTLHDRFFSAFGSMPPGGFCHDYSGGLMAAPVHAAFGDQQMHQATGYYNFPSTGGQVRALY